MIRFTPKVRASQVVLVVKKTHLPMQEMQEIQV